MNLYAFDGKWTRVFNCIHGAELINYIQYINIRAIEDMKNVNTKNKNNYIPITTYLFLIINLPTYDYEIIDN